MQGLSLQILDTAPVNEGAVMAFTIGLLGGLSDIPITVPLSYSGTAVVNEDYLPGPTTVFIPPYATRAAVVITTLENELSNEDKVLTVNIGAVAGITVIDSAASGTILNTVVSSPAPIANFIGTPLFGVVPFSVDFTDQSTGEPTSWAWDFGDTNTSTLQNPTHGYTTPGDYTVTLVATNAGGSSAPFTRTSYITGAPPFTPASLFANGEQGAWYDPSDFSTMFQDSAGATPVTAVEQPVGLLLDKSQGLVLGPEIFTDPSFDSAPAWSTSGTWVVSGGSATVSEVGAVGSVFTSDGVIGAWYEMTMTVASVNAGGVRLRLGSSQGPVVTTPGTHTFIAQQTVSAVQGVASGAATSVAVVSYVSVKLIAGNHAYQATTASKPVLSARKNLLTYSEQFSLWTNYSTAITDNATADPLGGATADKMVESAASSVHGRYQNITVGAGDITFSVYAKAAERDLLLIYPAMGTNISAAFNLTTGGVVATGAGATATSITDVGGGWYRCSVTGVATAGAKQFYIDIRTTVGTGEQIYVGDGVSGLYVWGGQLEYASNVTTYQSITTATAYDTVGFPHYLKFDGVDDSLATAAIDFSATDKMSVFAGVMKGSDAASAIIAELSAHLGLNAGAFALYGPNTAYTANNFVSASRGTAADAATLNAVFSPITLLPAVTASTHDIAGDLTTLRVNGLAGTSAVGDKGTGNFGNYPLYIGRRGGTSLPFNGNTYSLIVRGAASSAAEITDTEQYIATKMGIIIP